MCVLPATAGRRSNLILGSAIPLRDQPMPFACSNQPPLLRRPKVFNYFDIDPPNIFIEREE
jgi:hypothetical protein